MDTSEATVRVVEDVHELSLDSQAIRRARHRAESASIEDVTEDIAGTAVHMLPEHRRFEFRTTQGHTIFGKATENAVESYLNAIATQVNVANSEMIAHMQVRTIHALNREPRSTYRLLGLTFQGGLTT
jgi:hypothetical protein